MTRGVTILPAFPGIRRFDRDRGRGSLETVSCFVVKGDIHAPLLLLAAHPKADQEVHDLENDQGHQEGKDHGRHNGKKLDEQLGRVAEKKAVRPGGVNRLAREKAGGQMPPAGWSLQS